MESCTGGNLANILTDAPGASAYFRASYVTYTNEMKIAMGVPADIIEKYGAVSGECAIAMADAARERSGATVGVGITGVAGPGELEGKPRWASPTSASRTSATTRCERVATPPNASISSSA